MKVHSTLGNGFQEVIYQRALAIELERQGLGFQREMVMTIYYEGIDIGTRRVDFFVEGTIMLELKALIKLEDVHLAQAMNYCQAYNLPIGLLINFGAKCLDFKRVYNLNHPDNRDYIKNNPQSTNPKNHNSDKDYIEQHPKINKSYSDKHPFHYRNGCGFIRPVLQFR